MITKKNVRNFREVLIIALLSFSLLPVAYADEDDYPMMPGYGMGMMGPGHMGPGHMGMGQMGMGQMGMGRMGMSDHYFYMLDLSDSQRKAMRDIKKKTRTELFELQDKIGDYGDTLSSLYNEDKPDANKIGEIYQQIFNLRRQIIELHINTRNQQYDKLTKEQQEKLKELKSSWMGGYGKNVYKRSMMPHMMR